MWRFVFIAFLLAHGAVHLAVWLTPISTDAPFDPGSSWLIGAQRGLSVGLAVIAAVLLVAGGVGLWMEEPWWRSVAVGGLAASLVTMVVFFHPWFVPIQVINAALLAALLWTDWPSLAHLGA